MAGDSIASNPQDDPRDVSAPGGLPHRRYPVRITEPMSREHATTTCHPARAAICGPDDAAATLPPIGPGFEVDEVPLPAPPVGVSEAVRREVAIFVIRLQRGDTPEDIVGQPSIDAWRIFDGDELEREEALAHADIVLSLLARPEALLGLMSWMNVRSMS